MSDQKGLYDKYVVIKVVDGTVIENCFILKPDSDPAAVKALQAYAAATDNKVLAADLFAWVGKPMQKPLTLDNLKEAEVAWIECSDEDEPLPALNNGISDKCVYFIMGRGVHAHAYIYRHGKYWRAWASKPTDEERAAAPWEGADDADL